MTEAKMRVGTETVQEAGLDLSKALSAWLTKYGPTAIYRNCANCVHMDPDKPALCKKYNLVPPAKIIVVGCPEHDDAENIPF